MAQQFAAIDQDLQSKVGRVERHNRRAMEYPPNSGAWSEEATLRSVIISSRSTAAETAAPDMGCLLATPATVGCETCRRLSSPLSPAMLSHTPDSTNEVLMQVVLSGSRGRLLEPYPSFRIRTFIK
jgi:hypothetical protein